MTPPLLFPAQTERIESGPVQFGDDWPGTFIRGDHSLFYAAHLEIALNRMAKEPFPNLTTYNALRSLLATLSACKVPFVPPHDLPPISGSPA